MYWQQSDRFDPRALPLADRHYNRRKVGSPQFVPPGRCLVLLTPDADALWVSSAPFAEYVRHAWAGAWVCTLYRNESALPGKQLIRQAVAATRWYAERQGWDLPALGMVTFVNPRYIRPKVTPGHTFIMAGFRPVGFTKKERLVALQMTPARMPRPEAPLSLPRPVLQSSLWEVA